MCTQILSGAVWCDRVREHRQIFPMVILSLRVTFLRLKFIVTHIKILLLLLFYALRLQKSRVLHRIVLLVFDIILYSVQVEKGSRRRLVFDFSSSCCSRPTPVCRTHPAVNYLYTSIIVTPLRI